MRIPNPTVVRHFCDLATDWVRHYHQVPVPMVGTLHTLLTRIAQRRALEGGLIPNPSHITPIQQGKQPFAPTVWPFGNRIWY